MSDKIKSKDLSYDSNLPPFLQRLRAQNSGRGDQDLHERPLARPKKGKVNDEDDQPTIVDESGELLSKDDLTKRITADDQQQASTSVDLNLDDSKVPGSETRQTKQDVTNGLSIKKRKAAKVIEDDAEHDDKAATSIQTTAAPVKKAKKKAKPVKLAFEDDNG
ncbi:hypothetical protein MRB53_040064 [Persea americana]|nr:hypothetical protein MRB53_040064 [Persea americana]